MAERIGFVGLGIMGRPMAENLARRFPVVGFDALAARRAGLAGVTAASSLAELASQSTVICLSLPSAAVVEEVVLGAGGLLAAIPAGALVVDLSTSTPEVSRRVAARLAERGVAFADAPVSGGQEGARTAALAVMVGSSPEVFERARSVLAAVGRSVVRVGEVGAGNVAKLVNNMIVATTFATIAEGFALAVRHGVDPRTLHEAIKDGWAGSKVLDTSAGAIAARSYVPGGTIDMLTKDLTYALAAAAQAHCSVPMSAVAHQLFVAGQSAGHGASSQPALFELWARDF